MEVQNLYSPLDSILKKFDNTGIQNRKVFRGDMLTKTYRPSFDTIKILFFANSSQGSFALPEQLIRFIHITIK